ncbi:MULTISPECIES: plastocyanin/azurin family copper-binding protein [unclassified Methylophaga]|jgi:pseudoazurin|uniref:plastocyanin/azurin family copper-binding protein n=1 Tax=unclassified Methylophaga TaxID=2629249 RepID=UPI000C3F73F7|nr:MULTISPECIES: plastocyanin/azurin family copper-binding protein [unclassified Methylophaga]MAL50455.1 copper-binding protein [Methylophaga sp.]MBP26015.1 copper-binding protein [Methylophaga sp.]|tara:strand:+ start:1369 stop:2091 length:723 start_codon:yes stop_codon:yes gene_type:complete
MLKAITTFTQARNIAMALTMSFLTATLITGCGNDDSSDTTPSPETEMSSENQSNMDATENITPSAPETEVVIEDEPIAESDQTSATDQTEATETNIEAEETDSASTADKATTTPADEPASEGPETHTVMAQGLKYIPLVITIKNGDTVSWRNMPTHNTKSLDGLIPEDAEHWESPINENYDRTFTQDGIYVYKCVPHFGAAMGGVVIVGEPVNLEQIKNADAKGAAGRLVRKAISKAESM